VSTVHLISGLPCSGKTSYAVGLRADINSVLFSLDRWLIATFGRYAIADVGHEEHVRRVLACRELIWEVSVEFLKRDVDVILDDGFFLRQNRMRTIEQARRAGARAKIHFIDTPLEMIRPRLADRNARLPPFNFEIAPQLLDAFASLFERPLEDEGADLVVVQGQAYSNGPSAM
jgi:predicted kinase